MSLNVISNYAANVAHRHLAQTDAQMTESLAKLSAGTRVLSAKDDAAAMAIGSRLAAQVSALKQCKVNCGQATSMLQVADGAMARTSDILMRMKTLAVEAGSGQLGATERGMLNTEYQQLVSEVNRLAQDTTFNGVQLVNGAVNLNMNSATGFATTQGIPSITLRGSFNTGSNGTLSYNSSSQSFTFSQGGSSYTGSMASDTNNGTSMSQGTVVSLTTGGNDTNKVDVAINTAFSVNSAHAKGTVGLSGAAQTSFSFKVGPGTSPTADEINVSISGISASALGLQNTDVSTANDADIASTSITNAVDQLNTNRANIGASMNRLNFASANIATTAENTESARSNLLDLDVAAEMSNFTSKQILEQAGVAMLAQANKMPQTLLRLFQ